MAHFPLVHTGILGDPAHPEVCDSDVAAFDDGQGGQGIIATHCFAWQPQTNPENPTLSLPCREVFARGQRLIEVRGPCLEDEARGGPPRLLAPRKSSRPPVGLAAPCQRYARFSGPTVLTARLPGLLAPGTSPWYARNR